MVGCSQGGSWWQRQPEENVGVSGEYGAAETGNGDVKDVWTELLVLVDDVVSLGCDLSVRCAYPSICTASNPLLTQSSKRMNPSTPDLM